MKRAHVLNAAILVLVLATAATAQSTEIEQLRSAAEQGDADTQFRLGIRYNIGEGVPQDLQEAVKWVRLAAEQGHAGAQGVLGEMYMNGQGVPQDDETAHVWFNVAASRSTGEQRDEYVDARDTVAERMTRGHSPRPSAVPGSGTRRPGCSQQTAQPGPLLRILL